MATPWGPYKSLAEAARALYKDSYSVEEIAKKLNWDRREVRRAINMSIGIREYKNKNRRKVNDHIGLKIDPFIARVTAERLAKSAEIRGVTVSQLVGRILQTISQEPWLVRAILDDDFYEECAEHKETSNDN